MAAQSEPDDWERRPQFRGYSAAILETVLSDMSQMTQMS